MKKKNYKKLMLGIIAMAMMIVVTACSKEPVNHLTKIKEEGKIVLGTSADYPPYEFHKLIDGKDEIVGFDIEIAKAIASDLGVELEIVDMKFEGLLAALASDDIDFVVAGMVADEERSKAADFSIPYYLGQQKLIVRKEDSAKLKGPEDFEGLKIGVQKSTTQEDIAIEQFTSAEIIGLSKITDLILELNTNKIDGIILAEPVANAYAAHNENLYVPEIILGQEDGISVGVKKGQSDLVEAINSTLKKLIEDGSIDRLVQEATELADQE